MKKKILSVILVSMLFLGLIVKIGFAVELDNDDTTMITFHTVSSDGMLTQSEVSQQLTNAGVGKNDIFTVKFDTSVKHIGTSAFSNSTGLVALDITENITSIRDFAFEKCTNIEDIILPDSVTSIGESAFADCESLVRIVIRDSVTTIAETAFSGCEALTIFSHRDSAAHIYAIINGINWVEYPTDYMEITFYTSDRYGLLTREEVEQQLPTMAEGEEYNFGASFDGSVSTIEDHAFADYTNLKNVSIPDHVTFIGKYAFSGCVNLESISIPGSVLSIEEGAFSDCRRLERAMVFEGLTCIGESTFANCSNLKKIMIPDSVIAIEDTAFAECRNITIYSTEKSFARSYAVENGIHWVAYPVGDAEITFRTASLGGILSREEVEEQLSAAGLDEEHGFTATFDITVKGIGESAFARCERLKSVNITDGVESIGDSAFEWCVNLSSASISESVITIGEYAFVWCTKLESITVPSNVKSIGEGAFGACENLGEVTILDGVTSIGDSAFAYCRWLCIIILPNSVTSIGNNVFLGCLDTTIYSSKDSYAQEYAVENGIGWRMYPAVEIEIIFHTDNPDGILTREEVTDQLRTAGLTPNNVAWEELEDAFTAGFDNTVKGIGKYAFGDRTGLIDVTLPSGVESIGEIAFMRCEISIIIPDSVTMIEDSAFLECYSVTINSQRNSYAHTFAIENGIDWMELSDPSTPSTPTFTDREGNPIASLSSDVLNVAMPYTNTGDTPVKLIMCVAVYEPNGRLAHIGTATHTIEPLKAETFKVNLSMPQNADGSYALNGYSASVFLWDSKTFVPVLDKYNF